MGCDVLREEVGFLFRVVSGSWGGRTWRRRAKSQKIEHLGFLGFRDLKKSLITVRL